MKIAILFPGQGSQFAGMADPWLDHPAGKDIMERAGAVLGWDVAEASRDPEALGRTEIVQPAVFACDLAAYAVLAAEGVRCDVAAGHSLGEYAAVVASGAVDLEAGLAALAARAEAMGRASREHPGAMTALIGVSPEEAHGICEVAGRGDVLAVANENSPKQTVLSGSVAAVGKAEELARSRGARAVRLNVAGAFHSPLMEPALGPVREALSRIEFREPAFQIVPNVSGTPTTRAERASRLPRPAPGLAGAMGRHHGGDGRGRRDLAPRGGARGRPFEARAPGAAGEHRANGGLSG